MKKATIGIIITIITLILSGCTYTGRNDMPLFIEEFNQGSMEEHQIDTEKLVIHNEDSETPKTYYAFFPANNNCEYMLSFSENKKKDIENFSICIISTIDVDTDAVKDIFSNAMYAYNRTDKKTADGLFKTLKLDERATYEKTCNIKNETDDFTIEVMVNDAGCGIYVY